MRPVHNPYHFIPVTIRDGSKDLPVNELERGAGPVTHDRYADGLLSGRILCRLTTEDPVVLGAERQDGDEGSAAQVQPFLLHGRPALPASSLRGLISSLAEAASNSSLRVLDKRAYSYRMSADNALSELGMIREGDRLQPLLRPGPAKQTGKGKVSGYEVVQGRLQIKPDSDLDQEGLKSFSATCQEYRYRRRTSWSGPYLSEAKYQEIPSARRGDYERGIFRILGILDSEGKADKIPTSKQHEIFIPYDPGKPAPLLDAADAIRGFHDLADERTEEDRQLPFTLQGAERPAADGKVRLRPGDLVFFRRDGQKVAKLAISAVWRERVPQTSHAFFEAVSPDLVPFHSQRTVLTPAEQLFGFVEERDRGAKADDGGAQALRGRVRFSMGTLHPDVPDALGERVLLKILSSPKPPCPIMYFKKKATPTGPISKADLNADQHVPMGRKVYLHRQQNDKAPWLTKHHQSDQKQKSWVRPLRAGLSFYFHIDFDNLSEEELGLLSYALRPTERFRHKLGMGKALGLGGVRIDPIGLFLVDRIQRYAAADGPRYHRFNLAIGAEPTAWPAEYQAERAALKTGAPTRLSLREARERFSRSMSPDIRDALQLLGDPGKVLHPVRTPHPSNGDSESKSYEWFVHNDGASAKQFLRPVGSGSAELPWLDLDPRLPTPERRR